MKKKSVIQLLPNIGLVGGTAAKVKLLAELSEFNQIICFSTNPKNELYRHEWNKIKGVILVEGYSLSNPISNAILLRRLCKKYECNVIHAYFPIDSISASIAKLLYHKIRIVRSFEGPLSYVGYKKIFQKFSFKLHSSFIGISKYVTTFYRHLFGKEIENIITIYNCPASHPKERDLIHPAYKKELLSIGGLNPIKNTETVVKAVKILKERGIDVKYNVIGDGPLRKSVEKLIKEYDLQDNIVLLGFKTNVGDYLRNCSLYVHPANCEGFGMAVVEAMSYKCPIIVADACALPELVEDGKSGFVVDTYDPYKWADKIFELLSSQAQMDFFGNNAYNRYREQFSIERYVLSVDKLYQSLM